MKIELTEQQVQNLKAIVLDANIKGAMAGVIIDLLKALDTPIIEEPEKES